MIDDDMASAQLFYIVRGTAYGDVAGMVEAVADRGGTAGNAVDFDRHDLFAEQGDDAVQRPDPAQVAAAPAHRLGPGEVGDDPLDCVRQDVPGWPPCPLDRREIDAVALLELILVEPSLAQEALERLRRRRRPRALQLFASGLRAVRN